MFMAEAGQGDPLDDIRSKLEHSFINGKDQAEGIAEAPRLVTNVWEKGEKVLTAIEDELRQCSAFDLSVAFITRGGIEPLLAVLKELDSHGVRGRILTTDYLCFTQPSALEPLFTLKNLQIRMYRCRGDIGFHTKGYLFSRTNRIMRVIVGSSNITSAALTLNHEWNVSLVCSEDGAVAGQLRSRFEALWNAGVDAREALPSYRKAYEAARADRASALEAEDRARKSRPVEPNSMQRQFISELKSLLSRGEKRALLISATGTGKTYAAALAMRELGARSVLFLVHREQIAQKSEESFKRVLGGGLTYGLMSGTQKSAENADCVFGTVQTISRDAVLKSFEPDRFEYVIIDEAHHSEAASYKKIISWFRPKMLLGMTATPERTHNSKDEEDIFTLFDHNVALEIRLQDAIEEDLICPFHYFGVTDISVGGRPLDEDSDFSNLVSEERVRHIVETARYYGFSGTKVHGLIFCRRNEEARELSLQLNSMGLRTLALSGKDSQEARLDAVRRLESDGPDCLDYILTQEIFNEGIDIPCVNQVILLRPTESPIVFVQQLGRGLRRTAGKEFTVIIDFIANYRNNFMVPLALSGDHSWVKDSYRRYVAEGSKVIRGASTIHFDEISRKRIYASIDSANFSSLATIKKAYFNLKERLGRIPTIFDFDAMSGMDVVRIFDNKTLRCYHALLCRLEKKNYPDHDAFSQNKLLLTTVQFISCRFASGKRPHELLMLRGMLEGSQDLISYVKKALWSEFGASPESVNPVQLFNIMTGNFDQGMDNTFGMCVLAEHNADGSIRASDAMRKMLENKAFRKQVEDLVSFGLARNRRYYSDRYGESMFCIGRSYQRRDVARLLNWDKTLVGNIDSGYHFDEKTKTLPIFINYIKDKRINESLKYSDRFISPSELISMSRNGRSTKSEEVRHMIESADPNSDVRVGLFMCKKKPKEGGSDFCFLGKLICEEAKDISGGNGKNVVELRWRLDHPVDKWMYDYITTPD
jgi:superfamily II DNA or RNA helicase/HKD family nuclease